MRHPQWSEIYFYFNEFAQQQAKLDGKKLTPEVIATSHNSLGISMGQLRNNLKQTLDDRSVYHITFALTALLDEEMSRLTAKAGQGVDWIPLQKELFDLTNAGEIFFENLDEVLENPQFSTIVYEVFYFVLKKGFRGKYQTSANRINKYVEFLSDRIQEPVMERKAKAVERIMPLPKIKIKIWQYYMAASLLFVCVYTALAIQTNVS